MQHGSGFVLEVSKFYPGNLIVMDDERCIRAWVEVPPDIDRHVCGVGCVGSVGPVCSVGSLGWSVRPDLAASGVLRQLRLSSPLSYTPVSTARADRYIQTTAPIYADRSADEHDVRVGGAESGRCSGPGQHVGAEQRGRAHSQQHRQRRSGQALPPGMPRVGAG
jgi:hypothetical protein